MTTPTFLESLQTRRDDPILRSFSSTIRFELLEDGTVDPWSVTIADGRASVSRRRTKADCVARMDASRFDELARGEANAMTAFLRGEIRIEGDVAVLLAFARLFPAGPKTAGMTTMPNRGAR